MASRIDITYKINDARGAVNKKNFAALNISGKIKNVRIADSYTIDENFSKLQLQKIAGALANPLVEEFSINKSWSPKFFSWIIEIGYLPGVTDNVGATAKETIEDLLKKKFGKNAGVYFSQSFFIEGKISENDAKLIAASLYNPLIQRAQIKNFSQFKKDKGMGKIVPKVNLRQKPSVDYVNINVSDEELKTVGEKGIKNSDGTRRGPLAMDIEYMKAVQAYFKKLGRKPTDIELESIAQTWSEHCKHTIFADPIDNIPDGIFKHYIKRATDLIREKKGKKDICVSVFKDNSGAINFDDDYLISHKVETHNSPSALDPFGGAITGIVGVNRDTIGFGMGAKPIINTYGFCFGNPDDKRPLYRNAAKTNKMLSPKRIMEGVVSGVNAGGNCSGIPTPLGFLFFDQSYRGKPLVFVGTVGLIPKKSGNRHLYKKSAKPGDLIVMLGGRIGQDGIHGATFSSVAMDSNSPATAVQIGDPITQKKLSDAIIKEARDKNLYTSITDNGAGGLSCSVAEMAKESGGCYVKLDRVPLKYPGLAPWQIWISESQERMTLSVPKKKWKAFQSLMQKRGVEATAIGKFTDSGKCVVEYYGKKIMDVDLKFLHDGVPEKKLKTREFKIIKKEPTYNKEKNLKKTLQKFLKRFNIASFEFISSQYDHEVQGSSVIKPLQGRGRVNGDAAIIRPRLDSMKGVVLSSGVYPKYSQINSYDMAACAIDTAVRGAILAGADPNQLALLDNFCWCSSNEPERLWQLKEAAKACFDCATIYETPFISGKDSMFNDFKGYNDKGEKLKISALPTLLISTIGVINDITKSVSMEPKFPNDLIYILGKTNEELGGSEYYSMLSEKLGDEYIGKKTPKVDARKNKKTYQAISKNINERLISSGISVSRGGIIVALSKMAIAGGLGVKADISKIPGGAKTNESKLFSESQGRVILTINPEKRKQFEKNMKGNKFAYIGTITKKQIIKISEEKGKVIINLPVKSAANAYKSTFKNY
ncbi:phosphoribosylformylglycinamidine synthase subunit PurL [Candidatus Wolfebacteria bacterium]|nr:phosphoribosylformylglycinamidine synthase subunit PurL [Candidatus Wolfebacteria bacterium]